MSSNQDRLEKNDWVTWKKLDSDRSVMLDLNSGNYYTLNMTATAMWELLGCGYSASDAARRIAVLFTVEQAQAESDLQELAGIFIEKGFLKKADSSATGTVAGPEDSAAEKRPYIKPVIEEHEGVQEIAAAGTGGGGSHYSGGGSHYWYPN